MKKREAGVVVAPASQRVEALAGRYSDKTVATRATRPYHGAPPNGKRGPKGWSVVDVRELLRSQSSSRRHRGSHAFGRATVTARSDGRLR